MERGRFLLTPRWIVSHLAVVLAVVVMVNLGFWQLRRLDERRSRNELVEQRLSLPPADVSEVLAKPRESEALRYLPVTAVGEYDEAATVVVRNRSLDGVAGGWLVTPLRLEGGGRVAVNRGFVRFTPSGELLRVGVPEGVVTVEGYLVPSDRLDRTARLDLDELLASEGVAGVLLQRSGGTPQPAGIAVVDAPDLDEGPHLSYAVQWFTFSTIAAVGYPLVLTRLVRRRERDGLDDLDRELEELLRASP